MTGGGPGGAGLDRGSGEAEGEKASLALLCPLGGEIEREGERDDLESKDRDGERLRRSDLLRLLDLDREREEDDSGVSDLSRALRKIGLRLRLRLTLRALARRGLRLRLRDE